MQELNSIIIVQNIRLNKKMIFYSYYIMEDITVESFIYQCKSINEEGIDILVACTNNERLEQINQITIKVNWLTSACKSLIDRGISYSEVLDCVENLEHTLNKLQNRIKSLIYFCTETKKKNSNPHKN